MIILNAIDFSFSFYLIRTRYDGRGPQVVLYTIVQLESHKLSIVSVLGRLDDKYSRHLHSYESIINLRHIISSYIT